MWKPRWTAGDVLGKHNGIIHFTIGQRKGLNLQQREGDSREPLFVIGLNAEKKHVIVGNHHALAVTSIDLKETNWFDGTPTTLRADETTRKEWLEV